MTQKPQQFICRLQEKKILNERFVQYNFELVQPNAIHFLAGQHVSVQVSEGGDQRAYTIVSTPEITHGFELLVEHIPGGIGSLYFQQLQLGDQIKILEPTGQFTLDFAEPEFAFVATGSGIAPFRSMILQLLQQQRFSKPITLYWGMKTVADMVWETEFQELMTAFPNFKFHPTLSQSPTEWPLCRGRVTDCLSIHEISTAAGYYLCGGTPMILDVKELLKKRGVNNDNIHYEKFF